MKTRKAFVAAILVLILVTMVVVISMRLNDYMKICLFSEVGGVVTMAGKPVAGVEITRTASYDEKDYTDKTTTDEHGRFHFDPIFSKSLLKWDPSIFQTIDLYYQGKKYEGWETTRGDFDLNGELDDHKPIINLVCDLDKAPSPKDQLTRHSVFGVCKW